MGTYRMATGAASSERGAGRGEQQLDALGDARRRDIVALLAGGAVSVGELAERLPISRPAVSQHLKVLKEAGLVRDHAEGTRRLYGLDPSGPADVRAYLDRFWSNQLAAFAEYVGEDAVRRRSAAPARQAGRGEEPERDRS
ncbi:helix-turn-helix transcriptional regulator [Promicromonospora sp. AC04]|uniref:ArsR/SmtB family transcription factor n=1 Tax=Promicromonospora sp. AC04 TaxID=2135723 RepID=UPI001E47FDE8|nr:metalloregulator ArsR/SmtB family transcription factor [Promicromonospora sp. AC04]